MTTPPHSLVNGVPADAVPVTDRGLQYGDGLFETIAVVDGRPRHWNRHMARLAEGCTRLDLPRPDVQHLRFEADHLAQHQERGVLKIILTRGECGRGYRPDTGCAPNRILRLLDWPSPSGDGLRVRHCATTLGRNPRLAGIKHLNRLEQVLASRELGDADEGLLADDRGLVIEGTRSNLFLVLDGKLVTPALTHCGVAGIMRSVVIDACAAEGIPVRVEPVTREDVARAGEIFMTGSLMGIAPVRELDGRALPADGFALRLRRHIDSAGEGEAWYP